MEPVRTYKPFAITARAISSTALDTTLSFVIPAPEPLDFTAIADIDERYKGVLPLSESLDEQPVVYDAEALELILPGHGSDTN